MVTTQGMLTLPKEFDDIILRTDKEGAAIVRLKDVGHAELGGKDYSIDSKVNGKRAVAIVVYQQPGANAIETSQEIRKLLKELTPRFPAGLEYKVVLDTSKFTEASIEKVVHTFFEAVLLVVLVVFLFLQSFRATVIPILAVPIAIVGTYSGILMLGFSTNMLTLFGMILAIGLVVDDAIIVVENVEHLMAAQGLTPMEAAKKAMGELAGALIAIVLVLCSVFVPVAFLGGMTGTLYKQFAITIAISMALSGIIALTLSPALAARILKPEHREKRGFFKWFENGFTRLTNGYTAGVRWLVGHRLIGLALFGGVIAATVFLFKVVPGSFVPEEDQGYVFVVNMMPDAASLERTIAVNDQALKILKSNPAIGDIAQMDGYSLLDSQNKTNAGMMFTSLKPYDERKRKTGNGLCRAGRCPPETGRSQGRPAAAAQPALHSGPGHHRGVRVLRTGQRREQSPGPGRKGQGLHGQGPPAARADRGVHHLFRLSAAACISISTGPGPRSSACRCRPFSGPCRPTSARPMWPSSPISGASGR